MMSILSLEVPSPIGALRIDARGDAIVAIHLPGRAPASAAATPGKSRALATAARQLAEYFAGTRRAFDLPLAPEGTPFQQRVWRALLAISYGETCSYADIARVIDAPVGAARAVGAANGANPIAIVVPCHRVIGASGKLVGYGGGLPTKAWLLAHERGQAPLFEGDGTARGAAGRALVPAVDA
jgi:methylated-DNA-[protein]-cysteine S-methyltransferase